MAAPMKTRRGPAGGRQAAEVSVVCHALDMHARPMCFGHLDDDAPVHTIKDCVAASPEHVRCELCRRIVTDLGIRR